VHVKESIVAGTSIGATITHHVLEEQRTHAARTGVAPSGDFSDLLTQIAVAGKLISAEVNRAGLADVLGLAGGRNVQGEEVMKLDLFSNEVMVEMLSRSGRVCIMASEEVEEPIPVREGYPCGSYAVAFDPLDGSSNIDVNVSIGTIVLLQPASKLAGAGYIIYGSSTMLVYSAGYGVHGFTLDPSVGEFLLSHPNILIPSACKIYSTNEGNTAHWGRGTRQFVEDLKDEEASPLGRARGRYIGSLVADFHRNLLKGGIFLYPADDNSPNGKLRLLYEAAPLAFLVAQAGGHASTGHLAIVDLQPQGLHQRVPLIIGNHDAVEVYEKYLASE
jgi:fructose-1,6-bisphosphatase I